MVSTMQNQIFWSVTCVYAVSKSCFYSKMGEEVSLNNVSQKSQLIHEVWIEHYIFFIITSLKFLGSKFSWHFFFEAL